MSAVLDVRSQLLAALNALNNQHVTLDQVLFGVPQPNLVNGVVDPINNTVVQMTYKYPAPFIGSIPVYYGRQSLTDWVHSLPASLVQDQGVNKPPALVASVMGIASLADLLVVLNNEYNGGFTTDDFEDVALPTGGFPVPMTLTAKATSLRYTGSAIVVLYDASQLVSLDSVYAYTMIGSLPVNPPPSVPASTGSGSGSVA